MHFIVLVGISFFGGSGRLEQRANDYESTNNKQEFSAQPKPTTFDIHRSNLNCIVLIENTVY